MYRLYVCFTLFYRFRWDFLDIHKKTTFGSFEYLKEHGTFVPRVKPVFPPEDYPVWTSIATGKRPCISKTNIGVYQCNCINGNFSNTICFRYELYSFSVVNKVGNGKFWVDETDQRSNLLFISIDKDVVGAPAMVTRLEEVRTIKI